MALLKGMTKFLIDMEQANYEALVAIARPMCKGAQKDKDSQSAVCQKLVETYYNFLATGETELAENKDTDFRLHSLTARWMIHSYVEEGNGMTVRVQTGTATNSSQSERTSRMQNMTLDASANAMGTGFTANMSSTSNQNAVKSTVQNKNESKTVSQTLTKGGRYYQEELIMVFSDGSDRIIRAPSIVPGRG